MRHSPAVSPRPGTLLVIGLVALGVLAAAVAIWYQRMQTSRCLDFYGSATARRLTRAPHVELWTLAPCDTPGRLMAMSRRDVSTAQGIVHLRRGMVEDAGFVWQDAGPAGRLPAESWEYAFVFSDPEAADRPTAVVVDLDPQGGWLAVAGQPGRVRLGRLGKGLATWINTSFPAADPPPILPACGP